MEIKNSNKIGLLVSKESIDIIIPVSENHSIKYYTVYMNIKGKDFEICSLSEQLNNYVYFKLFFRFTSGISKEFYSTLKVRYNLIL